MPTKPTTKIDPFYGDDQYKLVFTSPHMAGLEVTLESLNIAETFEAEDIFYRVVTTRDEVRQQFEDMCEFMAPRLVGWNWADAKAKRAIPLTAAGLMTRDVKRVSHIFHTWLMEMAAVQIPLGDGSTSGAQVDLTQISMDAPSDPES